MTTIAWDGVTLAADRQRTMGSVPTPGATKIFAAQHWRTKEPLLYGCCGDSGDCEAFKAWVLQRAKKPEGIQSLGVMSIDADRRIWVCNERVVWHEVSFPYWSIGSGENFALGAMAAGKTAVQAIRIASQLDTSTGFGVTALRLPT